MIHKCSCDNCDCEKDIRVSFCPKCKSTNVKYVFGVWNLFGAIPKMKCLSCGFEMSSFPVLITSKKKLELAVKKLKSKKNKLARKVRR